MNHIVDTLAAWSSNPLVGLTVLTVLVGFSVPLSLLGVSWGLDWVGTVKFSDMGQRIKDWFKTPYPSPNYCPNRCGTSQIEREETAAMLAGSLPTWLG